jgi:hypothetical protein
MDRELRMIRKKIEYLRNDMIQTCIQAGVELTHPKVVHLSQLLDEQLNRYERYVRQHYPGRFVSVGAFPLFIKQDRQAKSTCTC